MAIYNQTNVDDATRDQNGESQFDHNQNVPCPVYKWLRGHNSLSHQRQGGGGGGVHDRLESFFIRKKDYNSNGTIFHSFFCLFILFCCCRSARFKNTQKSRAKLNIDCKKAKVTKLVENEQQKSLDNSIFTLLRT